MGKLIASLLLFTVSTACAFGAEGQSTIQTYGKKIITITFGHDFNVETGADPGNYEIAVKGQDAFNPSKVGRESKAERLIPKGWPYKPVMQHKAFLVLGKEMKPGAVYNITVNSKVTGARESLECKFDNTALAADLIKINQVGYIPDQIKIAYLGGYLGDLGPMSLDDISGKFSLINIDTDKTEFEGMATLSKKDDQLSGENVYRIDFSKLSKQGRYVIEVEGIGRSYPFDLSNDALSKALSVVAKGYYHMRCGTALTEPYTKFTHPECHKTKAKLVNFHDSMDGCMKTLPNRIDPSGKLIDGWGGWHDAGDYDRLLSRHTRAIQRVLMAYEAHPEKFKDDQFNIPGSGNGIPDVLDEIKWGLDWMERMFDPSDGAFYYRIETPRYGFSAPHKDLQQQYAMNKYPFYSCYAGVPFAIAARLFEKHDPELSAKYLKIAKAALAYGQTEMAKGKDRRGRLPMAIVWVATELYITTGEKQYHDIFLKSTLRDNWSYAICKRTDVDKTAQEQIRQKFISSAKKVYDRRQEDGYAVTSPKKGRTPTGGGTSVWEAVGLLEGYVFNEKKEYRDEALKRLDKYFGANPMGYSWITGLGSRYPMRPCHHPSEHDGIEEPVTGMPINGPRFQSKKSGSTHCRVVGTNLYPVAEEYPVLRNWCDTPHVPATAEFTFRMHAALIFAISFFTPDVN